MIRYWLTPPCDEQFDSKVSDICTLYREAPALAARGERVVSTDELTGVQALERKYPNLPPVRLNAASLSTSAMAPVR